MEEKPCPNCKVTKPYSEFYSNRARPDGRSVNCRACILKWYNESERDRRHEARTRRAKALPDLRGTFATDGVKCCARCGEAKEATTAFFSRNRKESDGLERTCRLCRRRAWLTARDTSFGHHRNKSTTADTAAVREWRHRIKLEMIAAYGGRCQCCGEAEPEFLTLDHIGGKNEQNHPWNPKQGGTAIYGKLKKMGWPKDHYRLFCWNCNCGSRWTGVCPHQR